MFVQAKVDETYRDPAKWTRMSIMSTAGSAFFSSDRTIVRSSSFCTALCSEEELHSEPKLTVGMLLTQAEYAADIWKVGPCPVPAEV